MCEEKINIVKFWTNASWVNNNNNSDDDNNDDNNNNCIMYIWVVTRDKKSK